MKKAIILGFLLMSFVSVSYSRTIPDKNKLNVMTTPEKFPAHNRENLSMVRMELIQFYKKCPDVVVLVCLLKPTAINVWFISIQEHAILA